VNKVQFLVIHTLYVFGTYFLFVQKMCKEVVIWKRLSQMHHNILPFLGVTRTYPPSMVSPWMNNGYMTEYVRSYPDTVDVHNWYVQVSYLNRFIEFTPAS